MKNNGATPVFLYVRERLPLCVRQNCFYIQKENGWEALSDNDLAIRIRSLYSEREQAAISSGCINEVLERLLQNPELQKSFTEETEEQYLNIQNCCPAN